MNATPQEASGHKTLQIVVTDEKIDISCIRECLANAGIDAEVRLLSEPTDTAYMDWLDKNLFHREMPDWDRKLRPDHNMWVLFAPKGHQGAGRNILHAAMAAEKQLETQEDAVCDVALGTGAEPAMPKDLSVYGSEPPSVEAVAEMIKVISKTGGWHEVRAGRFPIAIGNDDEPPLMKPWPVALQLVPGARYRAFAEVTQLPPYRQEWPKDVHKDDRTFVFHNLAQPCDPIAFRRGRENPWIGVWTDGLIFKALVDGSGQCALKEGVVYRVTVERLD